MISAIQKISVAVLTGILMFLHPGVAGQENETNGSSDLTGRSTLLFDSGWRFFRGGALGGETRIR
jgi:hypothetical protein